MKIRGIGKVMAGVLIGSGAVLQASAQSYTIQDLGTLGGTASGATGINNLGQVVGSSYASDGQLHAFLYSAGVMKDLGTLGGTASSASAINDSGLIVGGITNSNGQGVAAIWTSTGYTLIPEFAGARDVNASGAVLLGSGGWNSGGKSAIYQNGLVGPELGITGAHSINNDGTVFGETLDTNRPHVVTVSASGVITDLNIRGFGHAINNSGDGVGQQSILTENPGFYYADGFTTTLNDFYVGSMQSRFPEGNTAYDINDSDEVVGSAVPSNYTGVQSGHAYLWKTGIMYDLNDYIPLNLGWELQYAYGVNNSGQIVGTGLLGGQGRAFLLTPIPVPEPSALAILGGMALLTFSKLRNRLWPQGQVCLGDT